MANPTYVLVRGTIGKAWREAPKEEQERIEDEYREDVRAWRREAGAGVRYVCYYSDADPFPLDGYSHHEVFEVDDPGKVRAIREFYAKYDLDRLAIDVVSGSTRHEEAWTS